MLLRYSPLLLSCAIYAKIDAFLFSILMDHGANIIPHKHSCCVKVLFGCFFFFVSYGDDRIVSVVIQAVRLTCLPLHCRFVLMFCGDLFVFSKHAFLRGVISVCLFSSWCSMALTSRLDTSLVILLSVGKTMFERTKSRGCLSFY